MFPYNQTQDQISQLLMQGIQPQASKRTVVKVSGRNGAEAFQMTSDESVLLLDTTAPIVWLCQTDGAGYKTLTPYDISVHKETPPEDKFKSLEERIAKLEDTINAKSNTTSTNKRKSESAE